MPQQKATRYRRAVPNLAPKVPVPQPMHPTGHRDWPVSKISSFLANRNLLVGASCCTETWESPFYVFPTAGCLKLLTQKIFKMKHSTTIFTQCILLCFSDALGKGIAWSGSMPSVALISVRLIRFGRNARPSNECTSVNCVSHLSQRRFGRSVGLNGFGSVPSSISRGNRIKLALLLHQAEVAKSFPPDR